MSFLSFNVNKNHIYFLLLFVTYFFRDLMRELTNYLLKDKFFIFGNSHIVKRHLIDIYFLTPSYLLAIFPHWIEKKRAHHHRKKNIKQNEEENNSIELIYNERSFMDVPKVLKLLVLTSTFNFIPRIILFFLYYFVNDDSKFTSYPVFSSVSIVYILATFLLSRIFLSSYFYRHHFVSLAINIIGLIINIIIDAVNLEQTFNIILYLLNMAFTVSFSSSVITAKFVLNYISPFSVELYIGVIQIFYLVIIAIPLCFIKRNGENVFNNFFGIFDAYVTIVYLFNMIFICCYGVFIWIIVNKFTPNDYALSMMVENMIDKLYEYALTPESFTNNLLISILQIFIFILLIIGICIHNEIIVINKWGLDEYIKNNIAKKGDDDFNNTYSMEEVNEDGTTEMTWNVK